MPTMIEAIRAEYVRYKTMGEAAIAQLPDEDLSRAPENGNSIATICWHLSGNFASRFTDFLTSDGEKPWRQREEEFAPRHVSRAELLAKWEKGWDVLLDALARLTDEQLGATVTIRGQALEVREALLRSLAHVSYHVGQIVYAAKTIRGGSWKFLSIPPGQSNAYNLNPTGEKPADHTQALKGGGLG